MTRSNTNNGVVATGLHAFFSGDLSAIVGPLTGYFSSLMLGSVVALLVLFINWSSAADTTSPFLGAITNGSTSRGNNSAISLAETNGFGVQFFLVEDKDFFSNWDKPESGHFTPVSKAERGIPIYTAVIFAGASRMENERVDVTFDAVARRPDGSIYGEEKGMIGLQDKVVPQGSKLHLARDFMAIRIEPKDPAGVYTVQIAVKDNVGKKELHLSLRFTVEK